ncbi:cytidylate kinase [Muriicola jejuensis]|uniref:Cytidylate kinase n=1 Tax=Muriicola jejuensis TaxID=504488 RepID=A0A6P0U8R4_9FLAO|nr:(d)CMP kinase [Muriicola jejuensis]NER08960.1 (d)CMP kinase [Muriicola jejuensis]SMP12607.1 cytidylate kinase [Muriicola jejuensis]
MKKITIAIDGYSSTGKSTMAKQLARALGYIYVDTGAMYRAVTLYALRKGYISEKGFEKEPLLSDLPGIDLNFRYNPDLGYSEIYLDGENVEKEIRTLEVSNYVSQISVVAEVRQKLVALQKDMGRNKGLVMDGRDIGTVVFPNAELKIFMTASPDIRATRRYKELLDRGALISFEEVLENVQKRDYLDSHREHSPLKQAEDAVVIDNSSMSQQEQFERALSLAELRIQSA